MYFCSTTLNSVSRADNLSDSCVRQARYSWSSFYNLIDGLTIKTDVKKETNKTNKR